MQSAHFGGQIMSSLPFRQIHLDFHTSEAIPGIGSEWDPAHFQAQLRRGHVSSVTVFSKCHHGWSYHPTAVPLSRMHPHLSFDLMGAMIEAAHAIGVKTPVYLSAGFDEKLGRTHTHWLKLSPDKSEALGRWQEASYHSFCMRSPYTDYLTAQAVEVARNYPADGIFLDIVGPYWICGCQWCLEAAHSRGLDMRDPDVQLLIARESYVQYAETINAAVHAVAPGMRIFHNGGHIPQGEREIAALNTHLELESLPTGGWGYDHFPRSARYAQGLGMPMLGMTGKFHGTWGEFGGYKHPAALQYEAAQTLAHGACVSVGDQMHPYGRLDEATYALIGTAYAEVEAKEPWCTDVTSVADVGVLSVEALQRLYPELKPVAKSCDTGVARVLLEGGILFDVLDLQSDFSPYPVLVLPDVVPPDAALVARLAAYLRAGGRLLITGSSLLDTAHGAFALDLGARPVGAGPITPSFIQPHFPLSAWEPAVFVVYDAGQRLEATTGTVLAERQEAFFQRDYLHFCSHQHAPSTKESAGPAMVQTDNTVYLAYPAFRLYAEKGQTVLREIVLHGLHALLPAPTLTTNLPMQGRQTVQRQANGRTIVHLLYATPAKRGEIEVIEDLPTLHDVTLTLRLATPPRRVYLAPQQTDLPFTVRDHQVHATVPEMTGHQMVVFE